MENKISRLVEIRDSVMHDLEGIRCRLKALYRGVGDEDIDDVREELYKVEEELEDVESEITALK